MFCCWSHETGKQAQHRQKARLLRSLQYSVFNIHTCNECKIVIVLQSVGATVRRQNTITCANAQKVNIES